MQFVELTEDSPHHAGVCGFIEFYGTGASQGAVVLCINKTGSRKTLIAVSDQHIQPIQHHAKVQH